MTSYTMGHVMHSNNRLLLRLESYIFSGSMEAWEKVCNQFCKRQADLNKDHILQFKYAGKQYKLKDDVYVHYGMKQLHPELLPEFEASYNMFVKEVEEERRIFTNMLSHAIRIAKYEEDLIKLLPPVMHSSITESGFFQMPHKPEMHPADLEKFKELYEQYFHLFDERRLIGEML